MTLFNDQHQHILYSDLQIDGLFVLSNILWTVGVWNNRRDKTTLWWVGILWQQIHLWQQTYNINISLYNKRHRLFSDTILVQNWKQASLNLYCRPAWAWVSITLLISEMTRGSAPSITYNRTLALLLTSNPYLYPKLRIANFSVLIFVNNFDHFINLLVGYFPW